MAVHPGVYVSHTGPLTWRQRAWAAVLACGGALDGWSAVRAHDGPGRRAGRDDRVVEVVVRLGGRTTPLPGVRVRQCRNFDEVVQANASPPRVRYDDAILLLADRATRELDRIAILADACGGRRTTAERLIARMGATARLAHRTALAAVLADIADGTCSVLEHAYLARVERAHGLPRGLRQGYGQVLDRPCSTAIKVARLLQLRGWPGQPTTCPDCRSEDRKRSERLG